LSLILFNLESAVSRVGKNSPRKAIYLMPFAVLEAIPLRK